MKEAGEAENGEENASGPAAGRRNEQQPREAGMLIAVALGGEAEQARAVEVFRRLDASQLERAQGNISDGDWTDFDPLSMPVFVS